MKQYYILYSNKWCLQLVNNYHRWQCEEWHLISFYTKRGKLWEYRIGLLGFQLRLFKYSHRK